MIKRFIAVEATYIDTVLTVPEYPEEDTKLRATSISRRRDGNCANTLEVLQQLSHHQINLDLGPGPKDFPSEPNTNPFDLEMFLVSVLPSHQCGATAFIQDSFNYEPDIQNKVNLQHCIFRKDTDQAASSYAIVSQSTGSRTIINHSDLPEMSYDDVLNALNEINTQHGPADTWYHFEGRNVDVVKECITNLRNLNPPQQLETPANEIVISVEIERPGREGLEDLSLLADVVFYSKTWANHQGYADAGECVKQQGIRCVREPCDHVNKQKTEDGRSSVPLYLLDTRVRLEQRKWLFCTWGEQGSAGGYFRAWTSRGSESGNHECTTTRHLTPSWFVDGCFQQRNPIIDTIGAGNTWTAGMVFLLLRGHVKRHDDLGELAFLTEQNLDFANILAGIKVTIPGFTGLGRLMTERGPLLYSRYLD